ncbi:MAG TPA: lipocalin-like domain-containing protein [Casimicrobiaceae bacterium]|nr:lipocalin-like domain-containing protein [Casimicrobiaceae bacterium]
MKRRAFLLAPLALVPAHAGAANFPSVTPGATPVFPRDHGSHPAFRTEWWYVTAWVRRADEVEAAGRDLGVQITFFRNRPGVAEGGSSRFAPRQLLFAHAAVADPRHGRLWHDQRAARAGFGLAEAEESTTGVHIGDWSLRLAGNTYSTRVAAREFAMDLSFAASAPPMLQGTQGVSRKGPKPQQASYYYSRPHLDVSGKISLPGGSTSVRGTAWLDHEWSSDYLAPKARGWDWVGVNFNDGSALMAFRIRDSRGDAYWAGGAWRGPDGAIRNLQPDEVSFSGLRRWRSPRTDIDYPVSMLVRAGAAEIALEPLLDDQELDSRASVGTVYWEGAVRALVDGREVGRGYLELTGYGSPLKL